MAGNKLTQRVTALEGAVSPVRSWHWLVQEAGETEQECMARHVEDNGPLHPDDGVIRWEVVPCPA